MDSEWKQEWKQVGRNFLLFSLTVMSVMTAAGLIWLMVQFTGTTS